MRITQEERQKRVDNAVEFISVNGPQKLDFLRKKFRLIGITDLLFTTDKRIDIIGRFSVGPSSTMRRRGKDSTFGIGKKKSICIYTFAILRNDENGMIAYIVSKIPWHIEALHEAQSIHNKLRNASFETHVIMEIIMLLGYEYSKCSVTKYMRIACDVTGDTLHDNFQFRKSK